MVSHVKVQEVMAYLVSEVGLKEDKFILKL